MNNEITTEKKSTAVFLSFLKGLLLGLFDCLPFFQTKRLEKALHRKDENQFSTFFINTLPELIAIAIAISIFFFIPMDMMLERYHTGIYIGLGGMVLIFMISEIYEIVKMKKKEKKDWIISLILFLVFFALSFSFYFIPFKKAEENSTIPFLLFFLLAISSFLTSFSGISLFTPIFFMNLYPYFASYMNQMPYNGIKDYLFLFIILFFALFVGRAFYLFYQKKLEKFELEKRSVNLSLSFSGFLLICIYKIRAPWYFESDSITITAQLITILSTILAFLFVAISLTIPVYRKKKDNI